MSFPLEGLEMAEFSAKLICNICATGYLVDLRRMRLNIHNPCPTCGFPNSISEDQAIKAKRLLESLERKGRAPDLG